MGVTDEALRRLAGRGTELVARRWAGRLDMWVVCGYPKSGTTWLSQVVADYLALPRPEASRLPVAMPAVIHAHWRPHPRLTRALYLIRDGRDAIVSLYYWRMHTVASHRLARRSEALRERLRAAVGPGFDADDVAGNLPVFIELEMQEPASTPLNWPDHVTAWSRQLPPEQIVRYEDLLVDPVGAVAPGLARIGNEEVDVDRLQRSFDRFSFATQTGRATATAEDRTAFLRRGGSGGWKEHFTAAAAAVFDRFAGAALVESGYEPDRSWARRI